MVKAKPINAYILASDSIIAAYKNFATDICRSDAGQ